MDIGKILTEAWSVYVKNIQFLAVVALISFAVTVAVAWLLVSTGLAGAGALSLSDAATYPGQLLAGVSAGAIGLSILIMLLVTPWLTGANVFAAKLALEQTKENAWVPFQLALKHYLTFLLLTIVLGIVLGIGFMLLVIPGIILAVLFAFSPYVVVAEGAGVSTALSKGWQLGVKHFWTVLVVGIIITVGALVLSVVFGWIPMLGQYVAALVGLFYAVTLAVMYRHATK